MSPKNDIHKNKNKIKNSLTLIKGLNMPLFSRNKEASFCASSSASFTVEAAISVPVFLCYFAAVLFFFQVMKIQMKVQDALNYTGRVLSEYACTESGDMAGTAVGKTSAGILLSGKLNREKANLAYIEGGISGIRLWKTKFKGEFIELHAVYRIKVPTGMFGNIALPVRQHVKARKWTGRNVSDGEESEIWVYITKNGRVYHRTKKCSYLDLTIRGVSPDEVAGLRNKSGAKYKPCKKCAKSAYTYVYITDYGDSYHGDLGCGGLKRSIYRVKISEVGDKKACVKCGGEK